MDKCETDAAAGAGAGTHGAAIDPGAAWIGVEVCRVSCGVQWLEVRLGSLRALDVELRADADVLWYEPWLPQGRWARGDDGFDTPDAPDTPDTPGTPDAPDDQSAE
jgi:hypothetical protein